MKRILLLFTSIVIICLAPLNARSDEKKSLRELCDLIDMKVKKLKWTLPACDPSVFKVGGSSVEGRPLVYREFGNASGTNTTLIFTMVHPDEHPTLFSAIKLMNWLEEHIRDYPDAHVVVAPLVNPDGFARSPTVRVNARGIDVNRNFETTDWNRDAIRFWKSRFHSNPRRNPGPKAASEPETIFQQEMIAKFKPAKILSLHAPLNFLDYDGPDSLTLNKFPKEYVKKCYELRSQVKAVRKGFYPGSLGNYAGQERGIPTFTLEFPTAHAMYADKYWNQFQTGIKTVIQFRMPEAVVKQDVVKR